MPKSRAPHGIQFDSPLQRQWMMRSSSGRLALNAATVFGAASSSQRATKRMPAATISSTRETLSQSPNDEGERDDPCGCHAENGPDVQPAVAEIEVVPDERAERHQPDE